MNAAAKMIHQSNFFSGQLTDIRVSKQLCWQVLLLIAVLMSALAVVYSTNLNRVAFSQLQVSRQKTHQLQLQKGQLLLEQASLATLSRVQYLAVEKLKMTWPVGNQAFILHLK